MKLTLCSVWMPTAVTIANMTVAAPPITGPGRSAMIWPTFGIRPMTSSSDPQTATTHRLRIFVRPTSPTFSANAVSGNEFVNEARTADKPSVARPRARSLGVRSFSTNSPTAIMSAVDSV